MKSAAVLEEYLPKYPDHPGVLHYMIHSYDDPVHAPLGMRAARRYGDIAGDAPHALHMTSHIFIASGMWPEVIAANRKSFEVQSRLNAAAGRPAPPCSHGSSWENYAYIQQGRLDESANFLQFCAARIKDRAPDTNALEHLELMRAQYILGSERWNDAAVSMPAPPAQFSNALITYHYASAIASVKRNDLAQAEEHRAALIAAHQNLKNSLVKENHPNLSYEQRAAVMEQQVAAVLLLANGKQDAALATLTKARDLEAQIPYEFGPPFVEKPSTELLAEAQLAHHRAGDAVTNLRDQLTRTPGRLQTLRDLRTAAQSIGDHDTEKWADSQIQSNTRPTNSAVAALH